MKEYTPWAKHILRDEGEHPLLGGYITSYINRADLRKALNVPDVAGSW